MSPALQIKAVSSVLLETAGRRLDCGPYMSGALEAKTLLNTLDCMPLTAVTDKTVNGGIFNGPRFPRTYVESAEFGVPFMGSTDILAADLSHLPYLSKKQADANPELLVDEHWSLITCSGTVGRMAYSRADMKGMAGSQHFMRVVADASVIPSGYLHAFLSSRFGVPLITSGTYGAIIQHIEPAHIADLPVPRLGAVEQEAHNLVEQAARNRVQAARLILDAKQIVMNEVLSTEIGTSDRVASHISFQSSGSLQRRMDAYYYNSDALHARDLFGRACEAYPCKALGEAAEVWTPGIFKRRYVSDPEFGVAYFTGQQTYELAPQSDSLLDRQLADAFSLILERGMVIIQDSGQAYGLLGHPVMVGETLDGASCTNNMVRIRCSSPIDAGYLFALLDTDAGTALIKSEASGSSIPHLDETRIRQLQVPWPDKSLRRAVSDGVVRALDLRDEASRCERAARAMVEQAIERGGS